MALNEVSPQPAKRRDRNPILGLPKKAPVPEVAQLPSFEPVQHSPETDESQRFEASLCAALSRWDIQRRVAGTYIREGRIGRQEADRLWKLAVAKLRNGGAA